MDLVRKTLRPFGHAARLIFRKQLHLRLRGGVRLVWEDPEERRPPSRQEVQAAREQTELELILQQLGELMEADPHMRYRLRHLAFIEHSLREAGMRALYKVPLDVLRKAHEQFEGLVSNWEPRGLATLRSKMAVAVIDRETQDEDVEAEAYRTAAVLDTAPVRAAERSNAIDVGGQAGQGPITLRRL
jgi:hypothetical protein